MDEIREKIVNIIANNCSRPGFDEYTRSADQILALFPKPEKVGEQVCTCKEPNKGMKDKLESECLLCGKPIPPPQKVEEIEELTNETGYVTVKFINKINEIIQAINRLNKEGR